MPKTRGSKGLERGSKGLKKGLTRGSKQRTPSSEMVINICLRPLRMPRQKQLRATIGDC